MVTVSVTISDEAYERLQQQAAEAKTSVELIMSTLAEEQSTRERVSPEFRTLMRDQMARYERLFSRLAE